MSQQASWQADVFNDEIMEQDEECEDYDEIEPPPAKRKSKKTTSERCKTKQEGERKTTRRRHVLNKTEKKNVLARISSTSNEEITLKSLSSTTKEVSVVSELLKAFCDSVTPVALSFFTEHLKETFLRLYEECSTLKERYLQFQLKWHSHCSYFLVLKNSELTDIGLHPSDPLAVKVVTVRSEWHKVCSSYSVNSDTAKTFLISYFSATYNELLQQCQNVIKPAEPIQVAAVHEDTDNVYYRFGGGAIADMLKTRYNKMKTSSKDKDQVSLEITVLQKLSVHMENDKIDIPAYLKYRDEGYMYFPCQELLPFLKAVDVKTKEHTNVSQFSEQGTEFVKSVADAMDNNTELMTMFYTTVLGKIPEAISLPYKQLNGIFTELVRKLSHTRIQEFLDSYKQSAAAKKGTATLSGLNLRDSLLGHHVNLKSNQ